MKTDNTDLHFVRLYEEAKKEGTLDVNNPNRIENISEKEATENAYFWAFYFTETMSVIRHLTLLHKVYSIKVADVCLEDFIIRCYEQDYTR